MSNGKSGYCLPPPPPPPPPHPPQQQPPPGHREKRLPESIDQHAKRSKLDGVSFEIVSDESFYKVFQTLCMLQTQTHKEFAKTACLPGFKCIQSEWDAVWYKATPTSSTSYVDQLLDWKNGRTPVHIQYRNLKFKIDPYRIGFYLSDTFFNCTYYCGIFKSDPHKMKVTKCVIMKNP